MRILFHLLLSTLFFMAWPITVQATAGPTGHNHDPQATHHSEHSDGRPTLMEPENKEHDHSTHNWVAPEDEQNRPNPIAVSAKSITTGQQVFRHYCITCHGYNADGKSMRGQNLNPQAANLREMAGHHTDGDYHYKIRTGHGPMPHWEKTISHENIWHLVNFLQSLKPEKRSSDGQGQFNNPKPKPAAGKPDHHNHNHSTHKH